MRQVSRFWHGPRSQRSSSPKRSPTAVVRCFPSARSEHTTLRYGAVCQRVASPFFGAEFLRIVHPLQWPGLFRLLLHHDEELGFWRTCTCAAQPCRETSRCTSIWGLAVFVCSPVSLVTVCAASQARPLKSSPSFAWTCTSMSITWDLLFHHGNFAAFRIEDQVLGPEVYLVVLLDDAPHPQLAVSRHP